MRSLQSCASLVSAKNLDKEVRGAQCCILVGVRNAILQNAAVAFRSIFGAGTCWDLDISESNQQSVHMS